VNDFGTNKHALPLARIKKIMKSDEDVRMISAEAPILFAKACELFLTDLCIRSWIRTKVDGRRTIQRADVADAISGAEVLDFLCDIVPIETETNPDEEGTPRQVTKKKQTNKNYQKSIISSHHVYIKYVLIFFFFFFLLEYNSSSSC
jgi:histone H3/H4